MANYGLFSCVGIEIEYMLVDALTLNVKPICDKILQSLADGVIVNQVALGPIAISNELVMHVIELKNNGPAPLNSPLAANFQHAIEQLQPILRANNALLLPTSAHPWMKPLQETVRWPHDNHEIYQQYDKIFDCRGHGWSNLQCMHVNLPYATDQEFYLLHNAIRLLLPLLPALAASSPLIDGQLTQMQDTRLYYYEKNQQKIPSIAGAVIPEFIQSPSEYQTKILAPMYAEIAASDPNGILQHSWLNSRGAIPKFDCQAIEIRLLDTQECVNHDIAIAELIIAVLKHWIRSTDAYLTNPCTVAQLKVVYDATYVDGFDVVVTDSSLLSQWQVATDTPNVHAVWTQLIHQVQDELSLPTQEALTCILTQGNLSQRIAKATKTRDIVAIYQSLSDCLLQNCAFSA